MRNKLLAVLLVVTMVLSIGSLSVFAEGVTDDTTVYLTGLQVLDTERDLVYPLTPQFDADIFEYDVKVLNYVGYVQIQPTADNDIVTITVDGIAVTSGDWSDYIPLNAGKNVVTVKVSDNNGENSPNECEYILTIYRAGVDEHEQPTLIEVSEIPEEPDVPDTPNIPDTPDTPNTPDTPDSPDIPNTDNSNHFDLWLTVMILLAVELIFVKVFLQREKKTVQR